MTEHEPPAGEGIHYSIPANLTAARIRRYRRSIGRPISEAEALKVANELDGILDKVRAAYAALKPNPEKFRIDKRIIDGEETIVISPVDSPPIDSPDWRPISRDLEWPAGRLQDMPHLDTADITDQRDDIIETFLRTTVNVWPDDVRDAGSDSVLVMERLSMIGGHALYVQWLRLTDRIEGTDLANTFQS